jgi:hypothetical protein
MSLLSRNKQTIWYANPTGSSWVTDSNGFKTGEKTIAYGTPQSLQMSISASSGANNLDSQGMADLAQYGIETGYTHRATTEDMNCAVTEESIIWLGIEPTQTVTTQQTVNGETVEVQTEVPVPHNYKVIRKETSLNHLTYYLKEVSVG